MPETLKMGLKLLLITAVATFALALTHMITKEPIQIQAAKADDMARASVLDNVDEFVPVEFSEKEHPNILEAHEGRINGDTKGYTLKTTNRGYGGELIAIVGIDSNGKVSGIQIAQHSETPGLGSKVLEPKFYEQYKGMTADDSIEDDSISGITGATVSSKAVTGAVNYAIDFYLTELAGGDNQ